MFYKLPRMLFTLALLLAAAAPRAHPPTPMHSVARCIPHHRMDAAADDAAATAAAAAAAAAAALEYNMAGFREATERWYILSCALTLSGDKGLQPFSSPVGWMGPSSPPPAQAYSQAELEAEYERNQPSLNALVDACTERVPLLCTPDMAICLPLARLAAWTSADKWVRPLDGWQHPAEATSCEEMLRSLTVHLLEKWDVPPALHGALTYRDGSPVSEGAHRISKAFLHVHAEVGRGASVLDAMRAAVAPSITKTIAKHFVQLPAGRIGEGAPARVSAPAALQAGSGVMGLVDDEYEATEEEAEERSSSGSGGSSGGSSGSSSGGGSGSPLHALRRAQVASLGGADWVADAACESRLGSTLGRADIEEFALVMLDWTVRHQEALTDPYTVRSYLLLTCSPVRREAPEGV